MAVYYVTSADVGAPTLSGTNGDGCTVFDYILNTIAGLTIAYTATNQRVYTLPNGDVLRIEHDSAVTTDARYMAWRVAESASGISTLVDPYPTIAQVTATNGNLLVSGTANATARPWWAIVDTSATTGCFYFFNDFNTAGYCGAAYWVGGTEISALHSDGYAALTFSRNIASPNFNQNVFTRVTSMGTTTYLWAKRTADGLVKSTTCGLNSPAQGSATSYLGGITQGPACPHPTDGKIRMQKVSVNDRYSTTDSGSTSSEAVRLWMPRLFQPLHGTFKYAAIPPGTTWSDTSYGPSAKFAFFKCEAVSSDKGAFVIQYDGDWERPSG